MLEAVKPRGGDPPATCAGYNWADTASRDGAAASAAAFFVSPERVKHAPAKEIALRKDGSAANVKHLPESRLFFERSVFRATAKPRRENGLIFLSSLSSEETLRGCVGDGVLDVPLILSAPKSCVIARSEATRQSVLNVLYGRDLCPAVFH